MSRPFEEMIAAVREFHDKFRFDLKPPTSVSRKAEQSLLSTKQVLRTMSEALLEDFTRLKEVSPLLVDTPLYRGHLIVEETSELLQGMALNNRKEIADALGDLLYVIAGFAITYKIPIEEVFWEIHRSNMTKSRTDFRMKEKGEHYSPPDIESILHKEATNASNES